MAYELKNLDGLTLGKRLMWLRKLFEMSRKDVSTAMGVSVSQVRYWEVDDDCPNVYKCFRLADIFGVDPRCLVEGFPKSHPLKASPFAASETIENVASKAKSKVALAGGNPNRIVSRGEQHVVRKSSSNKSSGIPPRQSTRPKGTKTK